MPQAGIETIANKPPVTAGRSMPLGQVLQSMAKHQISAVVIVEDGKPIGIFTERDAVMFSFGRGLNLDCPTGKLMTKDPICVFQHRDIYQAYQLMQESGSRHLLGSRSGRITLRSGD